MTLRRGIAPVLFIALAIAGYGFWPTGIARIEPPTVAPSGLESEVADALTSARGAVVREPSSAGAWGRYGLLLRGYDCEPESDICFGHAAKLDPADCRWPYLIGLLKLMRDPDNALGPLERAVKVGHRDPAYVSAMRLRLADALLERGDAARAGELYRAELSVDPQSPRAAYGMGIIAIARDDIDTARAWLRPLEENPFARRKSAIAMAAVARASGRLDIAAGYETQLERVGDDFPWPDPMILECLATNTGRQSRLSQSMALEAQGRYPEAIALVEAMLRDFPDARSHTNLGMLLVKAGDHARADEVLSASLRLDGEQVQARYFLALSRFFAAEKADAGFEAAVAEFDGVVKRKPDHAIAHAYRGRALFRLGRLEASRASLNEAVILRPEVGESHFFLGETLAAMGHKPEARRALERAASLAPRDERIARALEASGRGDP